MNFYVEDLEAIIHMLRVLNDESYAALPGSPYAIPVQHPFDGDGNIVGYFVDEVGEYSFVPRGTEWFDRVHSSHS